MRSVLLVLFGRGSLRGTHEGARVQAPPPGRQNISTNSSEFFFMVDVLMLLHSFMYPFIYLCRYEFVSIYFMSWVTLQYRIVWLSLFQLGPWKLCQSSTVLLTWLYLKKKKKKSSPDLWCFRMLQDAPGFACIFAAPVLELAICPGGPLSGNGVRNQAPGTRVLTVYRSVPERSE